MKSEIISKNKNPFLHREEIVLSFEAEVAPSYDDVKKEVGANEDLIVINKVEGQFGKKRFIATVDVYNSLKDKESIIVIPKKVRKKMEADKKAAEEVANKKAAEEAAAREKAEAEAKATEEKTEEISE